MPGPSAAKKAKTDDKPVCPYGSRCYRKNPQHFIEYTHPKDDGADSDDATPSTSAASSHANSSSTTDPSSLPVCKYGATCYRKNLLHFAEYSHPTSGGSSKSTTGTADSGSDTDVVESEDEKKGKKNEVLKRGLSLVKHFSQMTEDERKELIKKAFEAKLQLQKELDETKDKVKAKEKELDKLQKEVNTGTLLVEGEKEALEDGKIVYFTLGAERAHKEGSAAQTHFRLAESQFYRLLSGPCSSSYRVLKVEYVVNPPLVANFKKAREDLKKKRGEEESYPVLAFHGTSEKNIIPICENGFKVPGDKGFKHKTDSGWYGRGVYFSEFPSYSFGYIQGATKLLLCQVLPGKVFRCPSLMTGASKKAGYDSHTSPDGKELIIFDSAAIVPQYIVHYGTAKTDFQYKNVNAKMLVNTTYIASKYYEAIKSKATKCFLHKRMLITGIFSDTQAKIISLIEKHGGSKGTLANFDVVVANPYEYETKSAKVQSGETRGKPIVQEHFLYDCIKEKKFLDTSSYLFE